MELCHTPAAWDWFHFWLENILLVAFLNRRTSNRSEVGLASGVTFGLCSFLSPAASYLQTQGWDRWQKCAAEDLYLHLWRKSVMGHEDGWATAAVNYSVASKTFLSFFFYLPKITLDKVFTSLPVITGIIHLIEISTQQILHKHCELQWIPDSNKYLSSSIPYTRNSTCSFAEHRKVSRTHLFHLLAGLLGHGLCRHSQTLRQQSAKLANTTRAFLMSLPVPRMDDWTPRNVSVRWQPSLQRTERNTCTWCDVISVPSLLHTFTASVR